jgi:ComF family protein
MPLDLPRAVVELGRGLLQLCYPPRCLVCGGMLAGPALAFCPGCREELLADPFDTCPRCAVTVGPYSTHDGRCVLCRAESFSFERALRLGGYEGLRERVVLRLKHHSGEGLAEVLGETWATHARPDFLALDADVIVPVPLYWWRRVTRGYNQSVALAHGLSAVLGLPCQPSWLRRTRNTPFQTRQTLAGRRENVRGAFAVPRGTDLDGRCVLLVDDVMTTGATMHEAGRALRAGGAGRVVVAALTRARGGGASR